MFLIIPSEKLLRTYILVTSSDIVGGLWMILYGIVGEAFDEVLVKSSGFFLHNFV